MSQLQSQPQVIVIDDEAMIREAIVQTLQLEDYHAIAYEDPQQAIALCSKLWHGVIICDVRMDIMDGLDVLKQVLEVDPEIPVIMFSAHSDITIAVKAIRLGAYDFLEKTEDPQHHLDTVKRALKKRQLVLENRALRQVAQSYHEIENRLIGQTAVMQQLRETVTKLASVDIDILIYGETGTGKEVVARCLHDFSHRTKQPFVALNCGALAESVIESELFGHEAGAFTGAHKRRIGKVEYASGGTLFLDEIESMPASLQVRLLRVLQERTLQRLGGNTDINVDIRVVAASKADLRVEADEGSFREDLYYRLNVAGINIPALDQRKDDIPVLFNHFTELANQRFGRDKTVPVSLVHQLNQRAWLGNVRELRNAAERWVLDLTLENSSSTLLPTADSQSLDEAMASFEREKIMSVLKSNNGQIELSAGVLGIPRKKLYLRMKKHGIERNELAKK